MSTETQRFVIDFPTISRPRRRKFFELAQKNIIKGKKPQTKNLSEQIDKIVYGV